MSNRPTRLVFVTNNAELASTVEHIAAEHGWQLLPCVRRPVPFELLDHLRIDLFLVDLDLENAFDQVKELARRPGAKVIALASAERMSSWQEAMHVGVKEIIPLPLEPQHLVTTINHVVSGSSSGGFAFPPRPHHTTTSQMKAVTPPPSHVHNPMHSPNGFHVEDAQYRAAEPPRPAPNVLNVPPRQPTPVNPPAFGQPTPGHTPIQPQSFSVQPQQPQQMPPTSLPQYPPPVQPPAANLPNVNGHNSYGNGYPNGQMPNGNVPGNYMPNASVPNGYAPQGQMPNGQMPNGYPPNGYMQQGQMPNGYAPQGQMPNGQMPNGYPPQGQMPNGYAPQGQMPNGYAPNGYSPAPSNRLIAVTGLRGGVGRSTIAVNLAIALRQRSNANVIVAEAHHGLGHIALLMNMLPRHTLASLTEGDAFDTDIMRSVLQQHSSGVQLFSAPLDVAQMVEFSPESWRNILTLLKQMAHFVVVDTSAYADSVLSEVLTAADEIIVVCGPDILSMRSTMSLLETLRAERDNVRGRVQLVLNRAGVRGGLDESMLQKQLREKISVSFTDDAPLATYALNRGVPFVLSHGRSALTRSINTLVDQYYVGASAAAAPAKKPFALLPLLSRS